MRSETNAVVGHKEEKREGMKVGGIDGLYRRWAAHPNHTSKKLAQLKT